MRKKQGLSYEVGYGRPPVASRFSTTNQPKRPPNYPKPGGKQMLDLTAERLPARRRDGTQKLEAADMLIAEVIITKAINGDLPAAREVYRLFDAEEDTAAARGVAPPPAAVKKIREMLGEVVGRYRRIAAELERLGLIRDLAGHYRISTKAKEIASRLNADQSFSD